MTMPEPWLREAQRPRRLSTGMCFLGGIILVGTAVACFAIMAAVGLGLYRLIGPPGTLALIVTAGVGLGWQEARR